MIIGTPSRSLASRLLASRPAVWVGLISYPLYLWHWPLLSLLRNFERAPSSFAIGAAVVLSIALAEATRRLVERPVHSLRLTPVTAGLAGCMIVTIGGLSILFATSPGEDHELTNSSCVRRYPYQAQSLWFCTLSKDAAPTILLLGDSHANHLYGGLSRALPSESVLSIGACMPTPGLVYPGGKGENGTCYNENFAAQSAFLHTRVIGTPTLKRVVISAMWRAFDKAGNEIDYGSGKVISTFGPVDGTPLHSYVAALERQIERIGDVPTTIVLDTPRRGVSVQVQRERQSALRGQIAELATRHSNVRVFDPMRLMCGDSWCRWSLLSDAHHLSRPGSDLIGEALAKQ